MNLLELETFNLSDAIHFHDELNPGIWAGDKLREDVRDQLLLIANDFIEHLGLHDLAIEDITLSGSNASYSYTEHSDIDLHILVDLSEIHNDDVYRELFDAKKNIYNSTHDILINGYEVELYVQDTSHPVISNGEYSVKNNAWIKLPRKRRARIDHAATKLKYEKLYHLAKYAIKTKNIDKIQHIMHTIKKYRRAGLAEHGEFGPENLAFKILRKKGVIEALRDKFMELHDQKLSLPESVNPDITSKKYFIEPTENVRMGDFVFNARTFSGALEDQNARGLQIRAYDPKNFKRSIGSADFIVKKDKKGNTWLESDDTEVDELYRSKGVAAMMYAFAKTLGNDIKRSPYQSKAGSDMWNKWGSDAEHLMREASGYIPSEKEKNDPRFKTALTVDINPFSIQDNAKRLGSKVTRAGIPPLLKP